MDWKQEQAWLGIKDSFWPAAEEERDWAGNYICGRAWSVCVRDWVTLQHTGMIQLSPLSLCHPWAPAVSSSCAGGRALCPQWGSLAVPGSMATSAPQLATQVSRSNRCRAVTCVMKISLSLEPEKETLPTLPAVTRAVWRRMCLPKQLLILASEAI